MSLIRTYNPQLDSIFEQWHQGPLGGETPLLATCFRKIHEADYPPKRSSPLHRNAWWKSPCHSILNSRRMLELMAGEDRALGTNGFVELTDSDPLRGLIVRF